MMLKRSEFSADYLLYIHNFGRAHAHLGIRTVNFLFVR